MARWIGVTVDPNSAAGGSTLDLLSTPGPISIPQPTDFLKATTGQSNRGHTNTDLNDELNGKRGAQAPLPFRASPQVTFTVPFDVPMARLLLPYMLAKLGTATGTAPAAITTPIEPVDYGAKLPSLVVWEVREDQVDKHTGVWIEQIQFNDLTGARPTMAVTGHSLYHETEVTGSLPTATYSDAGRYAGVTFEARTGASAGTKISCVSTCTLTFSNNFEQDEDVRFCGGENVLTELVGGKYKRRQFPGRHSIGETSTTGTMGFGKTRPDMEERALLVTTERLRITLTGDPIAGTTPPADELVRFDLPMFAITGGDGASELTRTGALKSSYEFGGFIDPATGKDTTVEIVSKTAVTLPV